MPDIRKWIMEDEPRTELHVVCRLYLGGLAPYWRLKKAIEEQKRLGPRYLRWESD